MNSGARPKRALGQNFLVDRGVARRIVDALPIAEAATVLEIGPGRGALTELLLERCDDLVVVELDDALAAEWAARARSADGLRVHHGSILDVDLADWADPAEMLVVGNIPYNITTPILFHLLERPRPAAIVLMVQAEVAQRIGASPRTKAYGALSVGVRSVARVETLFTVPAGAFRPRPRVKSAVIRVTPHRPPRLEPEEERALRSLVRACFQWRRKQVAKVFRQHPDLRLGEEGALALAEVGVAPTTRPDQIAPEEYVALARALRSRPPDPDPS